MSEKMEEGDPTNAVAGGGVVRSTRVYRDRDFRPNLARVNAVLRTLTYDEVHGFLLAALTRRGSVNAEQLPQLHGLAKRLLQSVLTEGAPKAESSYPWFWAVLDEARAAYSAQAHGRPHPYSIALMTAFVRWGMV